MCPLGIANPSVSFLNLTLTPFPTASWLKCCYNSAHHPCSLKIGTSTLLLSSFFKIALKNLVKKSLSPRHLHTSTGIQLHFYSSS